MHLQDTSHTLLLVLCRVQHVGTGVDGSGVNAEVSELTYERVCHDLEYKSGEGLLVRGMSLHLVAVLIDTLDSRDVCRGGHELKDRIQKLLDAFVPVSRSAAYRNCRTLACRFTKNCLHGLHGRLLALQVLHHQIVVQLADLLHKLCVVELCVVFHIVRDLCHGDVVALLIVVDVGLHLEQVDDPLEIVFLTDRQLEADGILAEPCLDLLYGIVEVSAQDVHLVDERHTRYVVCVRLAPYVLGLGLYAALRTEHTHCAVKHAKGTLNLYREVHVARSVDDVDAVL